MTNIDFSFFRFFFFAHLSFLRSCHPNFYNSRRGDRQIRQLHWAQHSSFFLQSQLSTADITESSSDISE